MGSKAYDSQSRSLIDVQVRGVKFESELRNLLRAEAGRIPYLDNGKLIGTIQADITLPSFKEASLIISVTHTKPDTVGHSNENKFQLKLGELVLWKTFNPDMKILIAVSGKREEWLNYVLEAFPYFFDDKIYVWDKDDLAKLKSLSPKTVKLKNNEFWVRERNEREKIVLSEEAPPNSYLRERVYQEIVSKNMGINHPSDIENSVFKKCMEAAYSKFIDSKGKNGLEWKLLTSGTHTDYERFWEMRSYFNPSEATVMMTLEKSGFRFLGSIAKDVALPSMLHGLGMPMQKTKVSEDFVLWSEKFNVPVFIQCKASGGGRARHGKNIQNRAKEQVGRGILYRCKIETDPHAGAFKLISNGKWYKWISVLDGDWGTNAKYPNKYIHMLQIAGYDKLIPADSLINEGCELQYPNLLSEYLTDLDCTSDEDLFEQKMRDFSIGEFGKYEYSENELDYFDNGMLDEEK